MQRRVEALPQLAVAPRVLHGDLREFPSIESCPPFEEPPHVVMRCRDGERRGKSVEDTL